MVGVLEISPPFHYNLVRRELSVMALEHFDW